MNTTDITKLDKLRHALLQLHKTLLDAQRIRYERDYGRVESTGELLAHVQLSRLLADFGAAGRAG